jgi:hypothetical protein
MTHVLVESLEERLDARGIPMRSEAEGSAHLEEVRKSTEQRYGRWCVASFVAMILFFMGIFYTAYLQNMLLALVSALGMMISLSACLLTAVNVKITSSDLSDYDRPIPGLVQERIGLIREIAPDASFHVRFIKVITDPVLVVTCRDEDGIKTFVAAIWDGDRILV